jgi:D-alanyl-D-alanine carboxypeptidase/D-alanyl-D-alanine-endopeptidase (penicillin-binding protein 4)
MVEREVGKADRRIVVAGADATEERPEAGEQFVEIEGLDEVVVGAGVEAGDPVRNGVAGGQHQDRQRRLVLVRFGGPDAARQLEPVDPRNHHVEHEEVRTPITHRRKGGRAVLGHLDGVPFEDQAAADESRDARFVFDNQDARLAAGGPVPPIERLSIDPPRAAMVPQGSVTETVGGRPMGHPPDLMVGDGGSNNDRLTGLGRALPEGERDGLLGAVAVDRDLDRVTDGAVQQQVEQRRLTVHRPTVDGDDDVAGEQAGFVRWAARYHVVDHVAERQGLALDPQVRTLDGAVLDQALDGLAGRVALDGEGDVGRGGAHHVARDAGRVDADDLAPEVEQRAARVAMPDLRVVLDQAGQPVTAGKACAPWR